MDERVSSVPIISSSRMVGVEVNLPHGSLFVISVYLPSRSGCTDIFREALDQLDATISLLPPGSDIIIMGDFNADLGQYGGPMSKTEVNEQGKILYQYINRWHFVSVHLHLQSTLPSFTYESDAHGTQSTIDHILCPIHILSKFLSASTVAEEPLNTSDHLPVLAVLKYNCATESIPSSNIPLPRLRRNSTVNSPNWAGTSKEDIRQLYTLPLLQLLSAFLCDLPPLSALALDPNLIDQAFHSLASLLLSSSSRIPPRSFHPHRKPGWSATLKEASRKCKLRYRAWVSAGRPRNMSHPVRQYYKQAKKHFRSCLRLHRKTLSDNFFASLDHQSTDPQQFFCTLRKFTSSSCQPITQRLVLGDRVFNNDSILDGWASYFESLSVPDSTPLNEDQNNVLASYLHSCSLPTDDPVLVEEDEVEAIVRSLPLRKAPGPDHITNEHLKFGSSKLSSILTVLFNAI